MLGSTQVTLSPTEPLAPEPKEVTRIIGAPPRVTDVETGKVKTVRNGNCKLRSLIIARGDEEWEEGK